jgi:hypothetical protein
VPEAAVQRHHQRPACLGVGVGCVALGDVQVEAAARVGVSVGPGRVDSHADALGRVRIQVRQALVPGGLGEVAAQAGEGAAQGIERLLGAAVQAQGREHAPHGPGRGAGRGEAAHGGRRILHAQQELGVEGLQALGRRRVAQILQRRVQPLRQGLEPLAQGG